MVSAAPCLNSKAHEMSHDTKKNPVAVHRSGTDSNVPRQCSSQQVHHQTMATAGYTPTSPIPTLKKIKNQ